MRPLFGVEKRGRSRLRLLFLVGILVTIAAAAAAAFLLEDDAPAATAVSAPTPSAVDAATAAGQDDVVVLAETEQAAQSATAQVQAQAADAPATDPAATSDDATTDPAAEQASEAPPAAEAAPEPAAAEAQAEPAPPARVEPSVTVSPATVSQGRTTLVLLTGDVEADRVFVSIDGYTGEMVFEEEVGWVGFVPIGRLAAARRYNVVLDTFKGEVYETTFVSELVVTEAPANIEQITLDPDTAALLAPELVAIDNTTRYEQYVEASGPRLWSGPWRLPVFGVHEGPHGILRSYNGAPVTDWHHGHDISADAGAPIVAPARGRVVFATELPVHGLGVILDHGAGVYSGYWHMQEIQADVGQLVNPGDALGLVGTTGASTGPHLHWEVIVQGTDVDPIQWTEATAF